MAAKRLEEEGKRKSEGVLARAPAPVPVPSCPPPPPPIENAFLPTEDPPPYTPEDLGQQLQQQPEPVFAVTVTVSAEGEAAGSGVRDLC